MKKIVLAGLFAIGLITLGQQQASAWVNSKFGIGLNWHWQAGGNNLLWGAWHNGQPPGPEAFGSGYLHSGAMPAFGSNSMYYGYAQPQNHAPMPQAMPFAGYSYPVQQNPYAGMYYNQSPYHFASYPREQAFYYYYAPATYYYGW